MDGQYVGLVAASDGEQAATQAGSGGLHVGRLGDGPPDVGCDARGGEKGGEGGKVRAPGGTGGSYSPVAPKEVVRVVDEDTGGSREGDRTGEVADHRPLERIRL